MVAFYLNVFQCQFHMIPLPDSDRPKAVLIMSIFSVDVSYRRKIATWPRQVSATCLSCYKKLNKSKHNIYWKNGKTESEMNQIFWNHNNASIFAYRISRDGVKHCFSRQKYAHCTIIPSKGNNSLEIHVMCIGVGLPKNATEDLNWKCTLWNIRIRFVFYRQ